MVKNIEKKQKKISRKGKREKKRNNLSIKAKLIIFSLFLSVIPVMIVGGYSFTRFGDTIEVKVGTLTEQLAKQNSAILNSKIEEVEKSTTLAVLNQDLRKILAKKSYEDSFEKYSDLKKIEELLLSIIISNSDISSITILRTNGDIEASGYNKDVEKFLKVGEFQDTDTYKKVKNSKGEAYWITGLLENYEKIHVMREITDYYDKPAGIIIFEIETKAIGNLYTTLNMGEGSSILIADGENNLIYNYDNGEDSSTSRGEYAKYISNDRESGSLILNGDLVAYSICNNGWKLLSIIPLNYLMGDIYGVGKMTIIIAIICIIISILLSIYITFSIVRPLKKIMTLMNEVEEGNLTVYSDLTGKSEIGRLSIGFNSMVENMRRLIKDTRSTFKSVNNSTKTVNEIAQQYSQVAEQVAVSVGEIANGASEQVKEAEDTTKIMGQLSSKIESMVQNINSVKRSTNKTKEVSNSATKAVKTLYDKTEEYAEINSNTKDIVSKLKSSVSEIINIVELIQNISEQTNLLALNAAIEAARSGEAGKGFAVVADEIRKLAEQSKGASNKITDIANSINLDVVSTVKAVADGNKIFGEQHTAVFDTDTAFKDIINFVEAMTREVEEVSNTINDIIEYKDQTIQSIESITSVSEESAACTEEVLASTEEQAGSSQQLMHISNELITLMDKLDESIEKFKVDN